MSEEKPTQSQIEIKKALAEFAAFERLNIALDALAKISLGHEYSCGSNEGVHCTCRAGVALNAITKIKGTKL